MYLPGSINERIGDLRTSKGLSQKELSALIEVAPSQLSRIESGETKAISSDILIKLARVLNVSADYILGLTKISTPKSYDISELGLSEGAVKALVTGMVDVQTLNRIVEHKRFPYLVSLIKRYFEGTVAGGVMARNDFIDMATATIADFAKENPRHKTDIREDVRHLKSEKLGEHEADLEKIKGTFVAILKDIKSGLAESVKPAPPVATADFMRGIWGQLSDKPHTEISPEDVSAAVVNMVGKTTQLDGQSAELLQELMKRMLKQEGQN